MIKITLITFILMFPLSGIAQITNPPGGGGAPTGAAGGDLGGTYPTPTVTGSHITSGGAAFTGAVMAGNLRFNNAANTLDTVSGADVVIGRNFTPAVDNAIIMGNSNMRYLQVTATRFATGNAANSDSALQLTVPTTGTGAIAYTTIGSYLNHPICSAPSTLTTDTTDIITLGFFSLNWIGVNGGTNTTPNTTAGTWTLTVTPQSITANAVPINLTCIVRV